MKEELIIAGFGGQGVMLMGQILAYSGMIEEKKVSWLPSYGPEMRGGTANCHVIIANDDIASPLVSEPNTVIAMNLPSLKKFAPLLSQNGTLFINSSLINEQYQKEGVEVLKVEATDLAVGLGEQRVANIVMLGAYLAQTNLVKLETVIESLAKILPQHRQHLLEINQKALQTGYNFIKEQK